MAKESVIYSSPEAKASRAKCNVGQACYDHELVYLLFPKDKHALFFSSDGKKSGGKINFNTPIHKKYHDAALSGQKTSYEWTLETPEGPKYLHTSLTALRAEGEKEFTVLGVVKDLSCFCAQGSDGVRDAGGRTFAQILLKTREDEKKKIASALHDEIGSTAVILTSILSVLQEDIKEDKKASALKRAKELDAQIKECIERVKNLVVTVRPLHLDAVGLDGTVKELVESLNKFAGIKIEYNYKETDDSEVDDEVKIVVYRVVQESLNNAVKHSGASKITVSLQNLENIVKIEVSDNGKGFKKSKHKRLNQIGLLGMEESVKYLGGKFEVQTALGKGTKLSVTCPKVIYKVAI